MSLGRCSTGARHQLESLEHLLASPSPCLSHGHSAFYPTFLTPGAGPLWACGWRRLRPFGLIHEAQHNRQILKLGPSSKSPPVESDFQTLPGLTLLCGHLSDFRIPRNHSIVHPSFILLPCHGYSTAFRVAVFYAERFDSSVVLWRQRKQFGD